MNGEGLPRHDDLAALHILRELERDPGISQREISRRLDISLGMTNLLIRRLARKAWIKVRSIPGRRLLYALTPRGLAEKVRKTRDFVRLSLRYYGDLRTAVVQRIRETGRKKPLVASVGAGELSPILLEAVREAGGSYAGAWDGNGHAEVLVVFERPSRARREAWERVGLAVIDLS
ncbi:MAG: winged helix-turn-helix transcriptional regulator [Planctomycetes bacterium]|nr:winged helix-turn-helix transcriptional regulator [Planctomycetota bacterium]